MNSKEALWVGLKLKGHFKDYDTYEDYQNRDKKKEKPVLSKEIMENRKKAEEMQHFKANYNPKPTDPKELKKYEKDRADKEDKDWREKNLLTDQDRERFDSWGKDAEIPDGEPELSEEDEESLAQFNKIIK